MTMLAAMFYGPMDVRLEERPIPLPGEGEVLIQVAAATTCGTDVKTFRRGHPLLFQQVPAGFGHEVAGVIAAIGKDVTGFHEGDSVVAANSAPCQYCFYCRRGRYSLCENPAAMTEPLACALHGIEASDIHPGDTVVVIGAGPLGLLLAAIAKLHGAHVVITGRGAQRLSLAHYYGADVVIDANAMSSQEQEAVVRSHTDEQRGADVVIEAVGSPETWALAARIARHGGLVNFFGGCPSGTEVSLDTRSVHYGELTAKGIFHHTPAFFQQALELITDHRIDVEGLITARFPLAFTLDVFDMLLRKQGIKYALIPAAFELSLAKSTSLE